MVNKVEYNNTDNLCVKLTCHT